MKSREVLLEMARMMRIDAAETCIAAMNISRRAARTEQLAELADEDSLVEIVEIFIREGCIRVRDGKVEIIASPNLEVDVPDLPVTSRGGAA